MGKIVDIFLTFNNIYPIIYNIYDTYFQDLKEFTVN